MSYRPITFIKKNLTGIRSGKLLALEPIGRKGGHVYYRCKCDCGGFKDLPSHHLSQGLVKSCGCLARKVRFSGLNRSPEYQVWKLMMRRCYDPKMEGYHNYGGRGIAVCDRWKEDPRAFIENMGKRPSRRHSIDRIDTDGPYSPGNCKWSTPKEQARNTRKSVWIEYRGQKRLLVEWADELGLAAGTIKERLRRGYSIEDALNPELFAKRPLFEKDGEAKTLSQWAEIYKIPRVTLVYRLKSGKTLQEALQR